MINDAAVFEGYVLRMTPKAIQFQSYYWDGAIWLPLSQVVLVPDGEMTHVVYVKAWLANKRGLLEFTHYSEADIEGFNNT